MLYYLEADHNNCDWEQDPVAVGLLVVNSADQQKGSQEGWIPVDGLNHRAGHHGRVRLGNVFGG